MSVWPGDVSPAALRPVNRHGVGVGGSADLSSLRCLDAKNSPTIGMCLAYSTDVSLPARDWRGRAGERGRMSGRSVTNNFGCTAPRPADFSIMGWNRLCCELAQRGNASKFLR